MCIRDSIKHSVLLKYLININPFPIFLLLPSNCPRVAAGSSVFKDQNRRTELRRSGGRIFLDHIKVPQETTKGAEKGYEEEASAPSTTQPEELCLCHKMLV